jgi:nitroreductase
MFEHATGPDTLLTTTRSVRRRLDLARPVPLALVRECVEIALQAPTGGNSQGAHFVVVTDAAKRERLAELYRRAWAGYRKAPGSVYARAAGETDARRRGALRRVAESADFLVDNLQRVPVHVIPCIEARLGTMPPGPYANVAMASSYGSILPAAWSFMLAARARGLGSAWTTAHLSFEREAAELLGIPYEQVSQVALLPTAYHTGRSFRPAARRPLAEVLHVDGW